MAGSSSIIIVTTRNEKLLIRHGRVVLHMAVAHGFKEAHRLFAQKAFKKDEAQGLKQIMWN